MKTSSPLFYLDVLVEYLTEPELIPGVIYNFEEGGLPQAWWALGAWWQEIAYDVATGHR